MGDSGGVYRVVMGKPDGKRSFESPRHRWGIILGWIFRKLNVGAWTESIWFRIGTGGGHLWMR